MTRTLADPATMLFDGDCGICSRSAAWIARRAPASGLRVLPLQAVREAAEPELASRLQGRDLAVTLHLVHGDGRVVTGAAAVIAAARAVPRWGGLARLADNRPGRTLLEPAYRAVARNRHAVGRAFGIEGVCAAPRAPGTRLR